MLRKAHVLCPPPQVISDISVSLTLASTSPQEVQRIVRAGIAPNRWTIGDQIPIAFNGTVGILSLNDTYYAKLISFSHNTTLESAGKPNAYFKFPYAADGKQLAFCDSLYGQAVPKNGTGLCMNPTDTYNQYGSNQNGWTGSYAYKTLMPAWEALLPADWRAVISSCTKYTDNVGNGTGDASNVTASTQKIFYLAEFEVFGTIYGANEAERNYQRQYGYYANGESRVHYRHDQQNTAVWVWLRSPLLGSRDNFRCITSDGGWSNYLAYRSGAVAPAFQIA